MMVLGTRDNGKISIEKDMAARSGPTVPFTVALGKTIWPTAMENFIMLMVTHIKGTGLMTRQKAMAYITMSMGQYMKVIGRGIYRMDKEKKSGLMDLLLKAIIRMAKKVAWVITFGQINLNMLANG